MFPQGDSTQQGSHKKQKDHPTVIVGQTLSAAALGRQQRGGMEQWPEAQPLDAAVHAGEAEQSGQAVGHGADEQRGQQVAEHPAQRKRDRPHAQAGSHPAEEPEQQYIGQRKYGWDTLKLGNAHRRGEQGGQAVVAQHLNQMRQTGRRRDRHGHTRADRELGPHRALAAQRRGAEDRLHSAAALHREQPRETQRAGQPGQRLLSKKSRDAGIPCGCCGHNSRYSR